MAAAVESSHEETQPPCSQLVQPKETKRRSSHEVTEVSVSSVATPSRSALPSTPAEKSFNESGSGSSSPSNHITVAVRVRPLPHGDESIIEVAGEGAIAIRKEAGTGGNEFLRSQQGRTEERMFDRVFGPDSTQQDVYAWSCQPLVQSAVSEGRSATIFVYGATGAGKTHTMFGQQRDEDQHGLIIRAIHEAFDALADLTIRSGRMEVKVSFLDIYNENVRDLLQEGSVNCKVMEDERRGIVKVANLSEVLVRNPEDALKQLRAGMQARKVEATAANVVSSRSHAVFSMTFEQVGLAPKGPGDPVFQRRGAEPRRLHSKICLIDLAGSERATQTQNVGQALKDGAKINTSLLALANCIDALSPKNGASGRSETPRKKPPYRDSKLTLILKASLTSDCMVSMIANVHPGRNHFEDSNNTLEYAKRASVVKAPVVVRRARANSLPASRPPSPSPPGSPNSTDSSRRELSQSVLVVAAGRVDDVPAPRRRGNITRSHTTANIIRNSSVPAAASANPRPAPTPRTDSRLRRRNGNDEEASNTSKAVPASARSPRNVSSNLRQRPATPECTSFKFRAGTPQDRLRASQQEKLSTSRQVASAGSREPETSRAVSSRSTNSRRGAARSTPDCKDDVQVPATVEPVVDGLSERKGRSSCSKRLSRCSESPIDASSSFGTASERLSITSSAAAADEADRAVGHNSTQRSSAFNSPVRSRSPSRVASVLELTPAADDDNLGLNSSEVMVLSPSVIDEQTCPSQTSRSASVCSHPPHPSAPSSARASASPVISRRRLSASSVEQADCHHLAILRKLVESLQAEKAAADERLNRSEAENARLREDNSMLRTANMEKDRQIAQLVRSIGSRGSLPGAGARDSIGGIRDSMQCSSISCMSPLADATP